ncbi:hypothetical protein PROFUN_04940 [Planoprotostelium fungivorum]|uniref:Homeobox domain-containing protein n=1 Tax=Planoprotostelium fungivorum TaxID=1890364 RepID=A0A2P6NSU8_9EUKA|nr:hypothetical protein PROFUN_04940 [Planoprotostelium fungivorum]
MEDMLAVTNPGRVIQRGSSPIPIRPRLPTQPQMNISSIISPFNFPDRAAVQPRVFFYDPSVENNKQQKTDCKKSPRRAFTARQKEELNRFYLRSPYPSFEEREQLASRFKTSSRQIQVWFQNQRSRWEKLSSITLNTSRVERTVEGFEVTTCRKMKKT